jgi:hypothetical protein
VNERKQSASDRFGRHSGEFIDGPYRGLTTTHLYCDSDGKPPMSIPFPATSARAAGVYSRVGLNQKGVALYKWEEA